MSLRLILVRTSVRPSRPGAGILSSSILTLNGRQSRPILKTLHEAVRLSIRRASTAQPAAKPTPPGRKYAYPEHLVIYHAGTGRTTFLACLKLTTIFIFVFFGLVVTPAYVKSDHPLWQAGGVFLCGLIPLLTVAYTTSPFVTNIHIKLPVFARQSRVLLERWAKSGIPASTPLQITTMSFIGKPRVSSLTVGDLVPVRQRLGLVNYLRGDVEEENARRKWYMFRAVGKFNVTPGGGKRVNSGFVWGVVEGQVAGREVAEGAANGGR
ncbi:hypothetical protein CONLIGDRAFT_624444 [Coniochaeta ligniaria NRRL 30616]|uniref:Uncharacterized protein n=1 Tax=Coniochaeta ligniaria NRRL 30616 TaxID=1408157 RepID=A0A1J7J4L5_9PEZI|nr:hypothetical protein CONLIGDRAFT_624444 [Coniochaeta ligniaria NRRL 30616]